MSQRGGIDCRIQQTDLQQLFKVENILMQKLFEH